MSSTFSSHRNRQTNDSGFFLPNILLVQTAEGSQPLPTSVVRTIARDWDQVRESLPGTVVLKEVGRMLNG
jgi:hypothetical protein